jgi:hypothetical protein
VKKGGDEHPLTHITMALRERFRGSNAFLDAVQGVIASTVLLPLKKVRRRFFFAFFPCSFFR